MNISIVGLYSSGTKTTQKVGKWPMETTTDTPVLEGWYYCGWLGLIFWYGLGYLQTYQAVFMAFTEAWYLRNRHNQGWNHCHWSTRSQVKLNQANKHSKLYILFGLNREISIHLSLCSCQSTLILAVGKKDIKKLCFSKRLIKKLIDNCTRGSQPSPCIKISLGLDIELPPTPLKSL